MKKQVIGYLGPEGTYSRLAADKLYPNGEKVAYPSFFTLFNALKSGETDCIILPIENSLNGAVVQNLDLLQETEGLFANAVTSIKIDHRLITKKGCDLNGVKRVYSHTQALGQCAKYLAENFPRATLYETASTAECVKNILTNEDAGIVGAHFSADGYELSAQTISDEPNNYTQFLSVVRGKAEEGTKSQRIFFSFTCRHVAGALADILCLLKESGVNMTEIESRPIKKRTGEFRFFLEVEGDYSDGRIKAALKKVENASLSFKLLGLY